VPRECGIGRLCTGLLLMSEHDTMPFAAAPAGHHDPSSKPVGMLGQAISIQLGSCHPTVSYHPPAATYSIAARPQSPALLRPSDLPLI
jgi:hypothetical protein